MFHRERFSQHPELLKITVEFGTLWLLLSIATMAFSAKVRDRIKEGANGRCQDCDAEVGNNHLIAAHIIHGSSAQHDKVANGVARCEKCEARYHLQHADCPQTIGLCKTDNDAVVYGHVRHLDPYEREILISEFPHAWAGVLKRLKKVE
jgi:hypothetical protein